MFFGGQLDCERIEIETKGIGPLPTINTAPDWLFLRAKQILGITSSTSKQTDQNTKGTHSSHEDEQVPRISSYTPAYGELGGGGGTGSSGTNGGGGGTVRYLANWSAVS
jgi:hypothetical protein